MPGHQVHTFADHMVFGRSYWKLHKLIDKPVFVFKRNHRVFFHDPYSATNIARRYFPGDPQAEKAAILHILLDNLCTEDPKFKKNMESLAKKFYKKWRRSRKYKRKIPQFPEVDQTKMFLKKMLEARKLVYQIYR